MADIAAVVEGMGDAAGKATDALAALGTAFESIGASVEAAFGGNLVTAASTLGGSLASLGGAFNDLLNSIKSVVGASAQFVQAFSPSTMNFLDQGMRELNATIGTALAPAMLVLGNLFRDVAAIIDPAMQALAPVIEEVAEVLGGVLKPIAQALATVLTAMAPIFKAVMDVFRAILPLVQTLGALFGAVFKALGPIITVLAKALEFFADVVTAVVDVIKSVIDFFADLLGLEAEEKTPERTQHAAAQNVQIKGFDQIAKDIATASFAATGPSLATTNSILTGMAGSLVNIDENTGGTKREKAVPWYAKATGDLEAIEGFTLGLGDYIRRSREGDTGAPPIGGGR